MEELELSKEQISKQLYVGRVEPIANTESITWSRWHQHFGYQNNSKSRLCFYCRALKGGRKHNQDEYLQHLNPELAAQFPRCGDLALAYFPRDPFLMLRGHPSLKALLGLSSAHHCAHGWWDSEV